MENSSVNQNLSDETKSFQERVDEVRSLAEENLRYTKAIYGVKNENPGKEETDLKQLLEENLSVSHEVYRLVKKINRQLFWQKIWGLLKVIIIVVPLVAGAIYLYPLLGQVLGTYQQIIGLTQGGMNLNIDAKNVNSAAVQNLINQIKK
jgi:hypothetical protein